MSDNNEKILTPEEIRIGEEVIQAFEIFLMSIAAVSPDFDTLSTDRKIHLITSSVLAYIVSLNVRASTARRMIRTMMVLLDQYDKEENELKIVQLASNSLN